MADQDQPTPTEAVNEPTGVAGQNEHQLLPGRRLGRMPFRSRRQALQFSDFFKFVDLPKSVNYWAKKTPLDKRTFGNDRYGNCTIAKQAYAATRMERIEQKRTIKITDDEIIRVYQQMCLREYGSTADEGAYEDDALSNWRNPEYTFKDTDGRPYTIDAFLRINAKNLNEVKAGLALSGAKGIAVCFNLPWAWADADVWDIPAGQPLTGRWMPGSWGGHSLHMQCDYNAHRAILDDTWGFGPREVTWEAIAAYMDEAHLIIDSVNAWKKQAEASAKRIDTTTAKVTRGLKDVVEAVNDVSSFKIVT
jgi:hypothetical protein